ncbi:hypothetical protein GCM10007920_41330 [Ciceribacter naphthalenivorans]|uniref:Uncharacterized protein n=2 Tax=Alphaproteobacteria TaxID=28211 RepID=A0A512HDS7_9HYPH|nr:hypothetical protein RNA01_04420 [Ciceribacter naphthalenivorans]GLR24339.1 hypothetical protein GCM10007920_41330 [Ciceribacter naphthalenivorans]GLT07195.1 hypothetical protein GCM10007926_41330 [Sphingomonas psychrolutea]
MAGRQHHGEQAGGEETRQEAWQKAHREGRRAVLPAGGASRADGTLPPLSHVAPASQVRSRPIEPDRRAVCKRQHVAAGLSPSWIRHHLFISL